MHSSPQFTRSTLSGKFTWVRAIKLGGISLWPTFLDEILLGESMVLLVFKGERKKFSKTWVT